MNIEITDISQNKIIKDILNETLDKAIQSVSDKEKKKIELEELIKNQMFFDKIDVHKKKYIDVKKEIDQIYFDWNEYFSNAMDILASYVKGQKLIYMEAESYCKTKLNKLRDWLFFANELSGDLS